MYKLIIIEDEYRIRAGLSAVIDWKSLGFEVTATFEDGEDFLDQLKPNDSIDVILTDIQMPRVGGIQIAQMAKKMNPAPKVVFISAFERLDYALSAIENNVVGYIFKPIDPTKLTAIFHNLRNDLDEEAQIREITANYSTYRKNLSAAKEYFFSDLLINSPSSPKTADALFRILYPRLSFDTCICFEAVLTMSNYASFLRRKWEGTSTELFEDLKNSIQLFSGGCEYWLSAKYNEMLVLSGICLLEDGQDSDAVCQDTIHRETERLINILESTFFTPFALSAVNIFQGIPNLANSLCARDPCKTQNCSDSNLMDQICEYIKEHIEDDLSLESLSNHFYLSQAHFSRLFKRKTGVTLVDYIVNEKIAHAKILLSNPAIKVYEVAERIGYKSVPHFNRQFKNYTGMTPNEYRKTNCTTVRNNQL